MGSPAIEVAAAPGRPLGMPPERFLRDYWQKRPLLIRGALPDFHNRISADDLAGLACEEAALARLVLREGPRGRWSVRNGPFKESDFAKLPKKNWTLLVQDVDKWDADVAALIDQFDFVPAWRIDDIMVSYAVDGGGVGAHVDNYDVFLVQGLGQRRWRISSDVDAPRDFRADVDLKLLQRFEPTHDWVLGPGDALYLPPNVPHEGVAVGECITLSVGMRAPSAAELILDLAESVAEPLDESQRYADPDLKLPRDAHQIDADAMQRVERAIAGLRDLDASDIGAWFGRFITRYRSVHEAAPALRAITTPQLAARLPGAQLVRNPWSRCAWARHGNGARLFVAGKTYGCPVPLARALCAYRKLAGNGLARLCTDAAAWETVTALVNDGHWVMTGSGRNRSQRA